MKKYMLFTYDRFYPGGGMNDFKGLFKTIREAKEAGIKSMADYYQVYNTKTNRTVVDTELND